MSREFINYCYQFQTYEDAYWCLKGAPHAGGHTAIGGLVSIFSNYPFRYTCDLTSHKLGDPMASPGEPLFYLHHSWLDKVWWDWQALDLPARLHDIGGTNQPDPCRVFEVEGWPSLPPISAWPNGTWRLDRLPTGNVRWPGVPSGIRESPGCVNGTNIWAPWPQNPGDPGNVTTMGHVLSLGGVVPNGTVGDVMDIGNEFLCYEYV